MTTVFKNSSSWANNANTVGFGGLPICDNGSFASNTAAWNSFQYLLKKSITTNKYTSKDIVTTYSVVNTSTKGPYQGGVLAPDGSIHFIPYTANVGQKVSSTGTASTYSLVYTNATGAYYGAALDPSGTIHFAP